MRSKKIQCKNQTFFCKEQKITFLLKQVKNVVLGPNHLEMQQLIVVQNIFLHVCYSHM